MSDKFLKALLIADIPEGKRVLKDVLFDQNKELPVVKSNKIIYEGLFDTDITNIKGYKSIIEIRSVGEKNTPVILKYILIGYIHKKENKWKIFEFRESVDVEYEAESSINALTDPTDSRKMQYRLRGLAYWQILNGELSEAKKNYNQAILEAKENEDENFSVPKLLILESIIN